MHPSKINLHLRTSARKSTPVNGAHQISQEDVRDKTGNLCILFPRMNL